MKKRPSESSTEEAVAAAVMKEDAEVKTTTTSSLDGGRTSSRLREKNPTYSKRGIVVSPSTSLASAAKALQNEKYDVVLVCIDFVDRGVISLSNCDGRLLGERRCC